MPCRTTRSRHLPVLQQRPAAKARLAGPPPPRPTNGPHGVVADGPAVGEGPAGPAGPPAPTLTTFKYPWPSRRLWHLCGWPAAELHERPAQHMATTVTATASAPKASSVIHRLLACSTTSASRCRLCVASLVLVMGIVRPPPTEHWPVDCRKMALPACSVKQAALNLPALQ